MDAVRRDPVSAMLRLAEDLNRRRFEPGEPARFTIQRADGTARELVSYPVRDKVVQRAALQVLMPLAERQFLPSSFGFRPMRSVAMAVDAANHWLRSGYAHVVDADLRRAFDSLRHDVAMRRLRGCAPDAELQQLVARCLAIDLRASPDACGLPQGAALSPLLCNLYLHPLDQCMQSACVPMVRFADDFVLLAQTAPAAERALGRARSWLERNGLELNVAKTSIRAAWAPFRFLGRRLQAPLALPAPACKGALA